MKARIVREELAKCQAHEGVNAPRVCKDLGELYVDLLRDNKVSLRSFGVSLSTVMVVGSRHLRAYTGQGIHPGRLRVGEKRRLASE